MNSRDVNSRSMTPMARPAVVQMVGSNTLPLEHSWPLHEKPRHFELGTLLTCAITEALAPAQVGEIGMQHAGCWECDLADDALLWSGGVYDIFGLPRGARVSRRDVVGFYAEHSRAKMEQLRSHAIQHRNGFTLDAEIHPASGERRWMRLVAVPVYEGNRTVSLHGLKVIL
jgi:PAS domain-containing protein